MEFKEINRRIDIFTDYGFACGPISITSVEAEIEISDGTKSIFLHGQWVDAGDGLLFEATEESMWPYLFDMSDESHEKLNDIRSRVIEEEYCCYHETPDGIYGKQYRELFEMIKSKMHENDWDYVFEVDDWEDEEDEG